MPFVVEAESVPLRVDENGDVRVGNSRVLFDLVVGEFENGATPETIVENYPTLTLADTYAAIGYYLRHPDLVADYLKERESRADAVRTQIRAVQADMTAIRERLLRRRDQSSGNDCSAPAE